MIMIFETMGEMMKKGLVTNDTKTSKATVILMENGRSVQTIENLTLQEAEEYRRKWEDGSYNLILE